MFQEFGIQFGPLFIHWYALCILSGAMLALYLGIRTGKKFGISADVFYDFFFVFMIFGIIGARLYYVVFNLPFYLENPFKIVAVWEGGLAIYGGLIGGLIGGYFYAKKKHYNFLLFLDIIIPGVILAQSIGRWGNFINQEAYGSIVPGIDIFEQKLYLQQLFIPDFIIHRMFINGNYHHPTFLYESLWNILGFIIIYFILRKLPKIHLGIQVAFYLLWYGIGRFFIEGMRLDSLYIFSTIRVSQALSLLLIIVSFLYFIYSFFIQHPVSYYYKEKFHSKTLE